MKVVALVSGGKDSCYAMMKCLQYGHEVVALANLMPDDDGVDELDSYMYQTVGHQIIVSYAECMGVPLFRRRIQGSTRHQKLSYRTTPGDEVEDMFVLLTEVKRQMPFVTAVSSGAIASDYQRLRVETVCSRLGLVSLAYLWKQDQSLLLHEMITNNIVAITVKVAAMGLDPAKHLGKEMKFLSSYLHKLKELYGINVCGEGGEYETLTLDCPLFTYARIVLDEYQVILHSSDSIAPVGVLHPTAFHVEKKGENFMQNGSVETNDLSQKLSLVVEVQGDCPQNCGLIFQSSSGVSNLAELPECRLQISKTRKSNLYSICCWLQDICENSAGVQEDMEIVLKKVKSILEESGFGWENVLYMHLYIANMDEFGAANETYVRFITQENCPFGVPSRSTIELPLSQVGIGKTYIEVLVSNDESKRVLHVQSISSWAPSCIGPYSQATLHEEILYMAGQLGLDPPTMTLCNGGPSAEVEQALKNSEAVAECFKSSISTSAVQFIIYCSTRIPESERITIENQQDSFLKKMRLLYTDNESTSKWLNPIFLYILVPDLPKRAHVEVKPILYIAEDTVTASETVPEPSSVPVPSFWGFQHEYWHDSCLQKCIVNSKICAVILSITGELAAKICDESLGTYQNIRECQSSLTEEQMGRVSRFCIHLLDKILMENNFLWEDITSLRLYFTISLGVSLETLSGVFADAFSAFADMSQRIRPDNVPIFNLVPVLGSGRSAASMNDIVTCELFARGS